MLFSKQSALYISCCMLSAVGLVLIIAGTATPKWTYSNITTAHETTWYSMGLWHNCIDGQCNVTKGAGPGEKISCQVLTITSAVSAFLCSILLFQHLVRQICSIPSPTCYLALAMVTGGSSTVLIIISASIWRAKYFDDVHNTFVGYSLILPVVGGVLAGLSGTLGAISSQNHADFHTI
ncbi:hypothetical protein BgiBS90_003311 [Biomphalaria glabrata]|nr:hypothetical protein BgiBS90_003311 [Biomphalaria glabrata]